ncbi:MAG: CoA transferase [Dehalococcoidia bacterium]|nr:CoA transferase [Dehalococcoidia bacterium]
MITGPKAASLPLEGIRVMDVTHIVAGPFCSMILADMGAEVIKIERPGVGERGRGNGPFIHNEAGESISARYLGLNRNKKSVALDLRDPRCKAAFERMVKESDILLDNWGPGALRRLGLGYDVLKQLNPALIYTSLTGYGDPEGPAPGPYSNWPANNPCVQGMGGWMAVTGEPGGGPQMVGDNIGDSVPGVWTALGIMMALEKRHRTGEGAFVDMSMYDCMTAHTTSTMPFYQATGTPAGRERGNMLSAQLALMAKDGWVVLAGAGGPEKWKDLWRLMDREDLIEDERYLGVGVSGDFYLNSFVPALEGWTMERTKAEVTSQLIDIGYSMGIVQDTADLDKCPHLEARGMFVNGGDNLGGIFRTVNTPIKFADGAETPNIAPPLLGANNEEILCSIGGVSREELDSMQSDGVI